MMKIYFSDRPIQIKRTFGHKTGGILKAISTLPKPK